MKVKKIILFIVTVAILLFLNNSNVYANMAHPSENIIIAKGIMRVSVFVILLIYIISCIIYLIKSKKSKVEKFKRLILWLVIAIVVCLILWYGTNFIIRSRRY